MRQELVTPYIRQMKNKLLLIEQINKTQSYVNLNHIVTIIESEFKSGIWKMTLMNGELLHITTSEVNIIFREMGDN